MSKVKSFVAYLLVFVLMITAIPGDQALAKVKLNKSKTTIKVGDTLKLTVKGTKKKITWKSSDKKVCIVSNKGVVKAKKVGKAVITAKYGKKSVKCIITVKKKTVATPKTSDQDQNQEQDTEKKTDTKDSTTEEQKPKTTEDKTETKKTETKDSSTEKPADKHTHNYVATVTKEATCKEAGVKTFTCSICGDIYTESIKKLNTHSYVETVTKEPTCKEGGVKTYTCSVCNATYTESLTKVGHSFIDTVVPATKEGKGYTLHKCKWCDESTKDTYVDYNPTAEQVYNDLYAMKKDYPEGMSWTNSNTYVWHADPQYSYITGGGCAGFAFLMSDAAFGYLPARKLTDFTKVRAGDIMRIQNSSGGEHSVIVLKVNENSFTVAEGNYNKSIHWGREIKKSYVTTEGKGFYYYTRYPE